MFSELLRDGQFERAEESLITEIRRAELVDPADDFSWGVAADALAYRLLAARGADAFRDYHQRLLDLFVGELEPRLGHLHKGHLYYRLASGSFASDFPAGLEHLRSAVAEDQIKAASSSLGETGEVRSSEGISAAAIALVTLDRVYQERIDDGNWRQLLDGLAWLRFEVALENMTVSRSDTEWALSRLVPAEWLTSTSGLHRELDTVIALDMVYGLHALLTEYWTRLLHGRLGGSSHQPRLQDGMGAQLDAVLGTGLPVTAGVTAAFRLADMWLTIARARVATETMDARSLETARLVAVTLKVMVDRAVFDWASSMAA
jgi:hypothetical protein